MKVVWIGHFTPYPPRGGAPQRSFNLLREAARHAEVHFVGLAQRGHQPRAQDVAEAERALSDVCASARVIDTGSRTSRAGKVAAFAKCVLSGRSYSESLLIRADWRRQIEQDLDRIRPEVVHVDSIMAADLLPPRWQGPAVLNHHNIESAMMDRRARTDESLRRVVWSREARLLRRYERTTASRFRRHLVVSDVDAESLRAIVPEARISVIPNGVDADYFGARKEEPADPTLIFAGRMNWYPNSHAVAEFLGRCWPELRRRVSSIKLIVAGMNPPPELVRAAETDRSIRVTGFVEDIRPVITEALVYVCPILDGGGTRLKLLDAMSLGMPIVATPLAAEGLTVTDGGEMLIRELGGPFVDGVVQCLEDASLRRRLSDAARDLVIQRYDWPIIGSALIDAWRRASSPGIDPF